MNYVDAYLKLDDRASTAETRAEEYRQRAEENRWEQCRIAFDAVESGDYSQTSFGREVGKSQQVIRRQCLLWAKHGGYPLADRPAYVASEADGSDETTRKQVANARAVLKDADAARELLADPTVREVVTEALRSLGRRPTDKPDTPSRTDDEKAEAAANALAILLLRERQGEWKPSATTSAILYFLTELLDDRQLPKAVSDEMIAEIEEELRAKAEGR